MADRALALIRGGDDDLADAVFAAGPDDADAVLRLLGHPSAEVRMAIARSLPYLVVYGDEPGADLVAAAIVLASDAVPRVRDWACFALGTQWRDVDTPELREALVARLDDIHADTRHEALVGLAYRQDPRALPHVRAGLAQDDVYRLAMVAAGALGAPELHELALRHRTGWASPADESTVEAVCRLTDPLGPGEDVLQGAATVLRRRSRGLADGRQSARWLLFVEMLDIADHRSDELYGAVLERLAGDEQASHYARGMAGLGWQRPTSGA